MATMHPASAPAAPEGAPIPVPDAGMVFSTVKIVQTKEAFVALEHPADWTPKQIQTAAGTRRGDIAATADWWDAGTTTVVTELHPAKFEPDNKHRLPFALGPDDLTAPAPIAIVK